MEPSRGTGRASVRRIKLTYFSVVWLFWFANVLPAAVLVLLVQARGLTLFQIGVLLGIYSLTIVALELPTGGLADAVGRKRVTLWAYSFMMLSNLVLLVAFSFPVFLLFAVVQGIGRALASGALEAWFIDSLQEAHPEINLQPPLALAGSIELLALGTGTLVGGVIPTLFRGLPQEGTAVLTPFSMTVVFSILMFMAALFAVVCLVREDRSALAAGGNTISGVRAIPTMVGEAFNLSRRNPTILLLLAAFLASGMALSVVEAFWQPRFAALLGGSAGNSVVFGVLLTGSFGLGMLGNLLSMPLSRFFRQRYGLVAALFQGLQGLLLVVLAQQTETVAAALLFWLLYFSRGTIHSPHATLFNEEVPKARRSSMLSVQSLATYVGGFLASAGLGYVAERTSISTAWTIAGVVLALSMVLYLQVDARSARPSL
jgi:DHA1 family quinolone resistance protein-like MFS transporter